MSSSEHPVSTLSPEAKRRLLADLLQKRASAADAQSLAVDPHAPFPLNDMQQAFWVGRSSSVQLGNIGIHGYLELEVHDLDLPRATRAFRQLIARHEMLRAIISPDGTQRVLPQVPDFDIPLEDLSSASESDKQARQLAIREDLAHQLFDVQRWPLFDIRAAKLDARSSLLFFSIDLIATDTRSVVTLFREWAAHYDDPALVAPPLGYTFRDYVLQEPARAQSAAYLRAEQYWTSRLESLPDAPQLPLRVDPSTIREPRFVRHAATLEAPSWAALKERAQEHGLTASVVLCAAYAEVLARWSKNAHFTLNVIPAIREPVHPDIHRVVGPFSSIDLLEIDLRERRSFLETARALQARLYEDLDHMQYSGVKVLRKLAQRRGSGLDALMPIVFTSTMLDLRELEGLGRIRYMLSQTPQVWIDHQFAERDGALSFNWDVVEALFPAGMMAEMFAAFAARVRQLATDPAALSQSEPDLLLPAALAARSEANATDAPASEALLQDAIWEQVRRDPEREAIVAPGRRLRYGELRREARALSHRLLARGVCANQLVAVSFPKGWEQVVAVLGILDAGAAYLPLDPSLPAARRELLLERAGCALVVSAPEYVVDLSELCQRKLVQLGAEESVGEPAALVRANPDDLAYVIYTSGSTGMPKGVMLTHRAALNTIDDVNARFDVSPSDRVLALSSLSFDLSVYDIFGVLAAGGCIVVPEPNSERDPARWLELIEKEQVSLWNSVPALMRLLVECADGGAALPSLRLVLLSGDWIPINLPDAIRKLAANARIVSLGGATEAGIWSIYHCIERVAPEWTSIPYGRPLRNQRWSVRDAALRDCPTWVPGELYIAGTGLAAGYLHDAGRTRASFRVDPVSGERLYRTGDLGRYWPDGTIEFLGREDAQVKISGHRIELEEIEAHLVRHSGVRAAVVRAHGDRHDKRLIAYVVRDASTQPGRDEERAIASLRGQLAERLPDYMVPRQFVFLAELPLGANGKVDAAALPLPAAAPCAAVDGGEASSAERARIERVVREAWQQVLELTSVSPSANFFELGGDSLRMVRVRRLLHERLGREIPMVELYSRPKPSALASYLAQGVAAPAPDRDAGVVSSAEPTDNAKQRAARRVRALGTRGGR